MQRESKFGKQRMDDFHIDKTFINLNHGSFGTIPKVVLAEKQKLTEQMEFNTQIWFRRDAEILINQTRSFIANKVNTYEQNIFMAQNATDAINSLMKSLHWQQGDVILLPNIAYTSVRKTIQWIKDYWKVQILNVDFTFQDLQSSESILMKIEETVNAFKKKIKLAIFDHISSMPSIIFPIQQIKLFLDQKGIDLFVDGAHAIGQVDIDLVNLQCAAYFSNLHKWAFAPKTAAFIFVSNKYLDVIRPSITGNFKGQGIAKEFFWTGTRDLTSYICAIKGIQYLESFGHNAVRDYNKNTAMQGAKLMANLWNTRLLSKDQNLSGSMVSVILPTDDIELAVRMKDELLYQHNMNFLVNKFDGKIYCRISAQIYNELEDYRKVAELFLELLNKKSTNKPKN